MQMLRTLLSYVIIIIFVVILRTYIITPVEVTGNSMEPTLNNGEFMFLNKINYKLNDIKRFDIVVIKTPKILIIKRIIGLPSEEVYIKSGVVYINGEELKQDFKYNLSDDDYTILDSGYLKIPEDMYFVLGDNRPNSVDSRIIGLIDKKDILGQTSFVIFPFNKFGSKE